MNNRCKYCGGDGKVIKENATSYTFKCIFCGNEYTCEKEQALKPKAAEVEVTPVVANQTVSSGEDVYEKCINGVVALTGVLGNNGYAGSGFVINNNGFVLTNAHVIRAEGRQLNNLTAYVAGQNIAASVVAIASNDDLALVKLSRMSPTIKSMNFSSKAVRTGQRLFVIGNALGMGTCITSGIISDKRRIVEGKPRLMTDCAVNHGNSGGPVFDENGNVIGVIVSGIDAAEGMNFAIPVDIALGFLQNLGVEYRSI